MWRREGDSRYVLDVGRTVVPPLQKSGFMRGPVIRVGARENVCLAHDVVGYGTWDERDERLSVWPVACGKHEVGWGMALC